MDNAAWELFRRGQLDQDRHHQRIRDAIKRNLGDLIINADIGAGSGTVRIPVKVMPQYKFEFDPANQDDTGAFPQEGQGGGQGGRPKKGDVVGHKPQRGQGQPGQGGDGDGDEGTYEVEIGVEHVAEAVFADLELPNLQRKLQAPAFIEEDVPESVRKRGPISALLKRQTVMQNIMRNAAKGEAKFGDLRDDDLRFRAYDTKRIPRDRVAVVFIRDRSGSMGDYEKHMTRMLSFWITRFLEHKYRKVVEKAFVMFATEAAEYSEEDYFHLSEGGGTKMSAGLEFAHKLILERFPPESYNLYTFMFSDGDNLSSDTEAMVAGTRALADICNLFGYAEIDPDATSPAHYRATTAMKYLNEMNHPAFSGVTVKDAEGVHRAMQTWFKRRGKVAVG